MGLDISKITNAELQKLANLQDCDNSKFLDSTEFTIFKQEAAKLAGVSAEDFNQAMGLYKTEAAQATEATVQTTTIEKTLTRKEKRAAKKNLKERQHDIKNDIKALIDGKKSARLVEESNISLDNLTTKLAEKNTNSEYKEVIADVQKVVDFVKGTNFNSKKEVEALEKRIKKNDDFNDFQKDLAENMVELAKREQINKEAEVLVGIYNEVRADKTKAQNFTAYLDDVKTEMERRNLKNTSYYSDEAFDALEDYVKQEVEEMTKNKRKAMIKNGAEFDSEKEVKNAILDSLPEDDKFARKVAKKEKDMNGVTGRWLDKDRRAEDLEKITENELKDELGKNLFNLLNRSYLHTKRNPDGTYNVRELSDALFERVGYDVWMNMSDDTQMSELQGVKNELKYLTGRDLKDKDIKKIMKLVHIKKEPKDRNILRALKENVLPAITGAIVGGAVSPRIENTNRLLVTLDAESNANATVDALTDAGANISTTTNPDGSITISILQKQLVDLRVLSALVGAGVGVLTGTMMNLIFGMENNEKSCISIADFDLTNEQFTNIDKYKDYIRKIQPEAKANLVSALADTLYKEYGDDWAKHYDSMLKKFAGRGSVLNCLEFRAGQLVDVKKVENTNDNNNIENNTDNNTTVDDSRYSTKDKKAVEATYEDIPAIDGSTTSWRKIAYQYDCLVEKYTLNGAIKILKIAQAINNGDYSAENIDKLYKLTMSDGHNGRVALRNIEGIDYQKYCDVLKATYLPALEKDSNGKNIPGTGVKVPAALGDCTRNAELSLKEGKMKQAKRLVGPSGHAADRRKLSDGSAAQYFARFNGGPVQTYTDLQKRDDAVRDFKKKHPNAKVEKWAD